MREEHHEIQTPKKENVTVSSNRKPKSINAPSKKLHHQQRKSTKLNSSSVFTPITEGDVLLNLPEESIEKVSSFSGAVDSDRSTADISKTNLNSDYTLVSDNAVALQFAEESARISPISEAFVFDDDQPSIESYIASLNQYISPSSITYGSLEVTPLSSKSPGETTPLSSITTVETTPSSSTSTTTADDAAIYGATIHYTKSIKLESVVKHLRESMFQVLHSSDIDINHKKLLDALVKMVIKEFCSLHEERCLVVGLFSKKLQLVLLSYLLGLLLVCVGFIFFADVQSSYHGPPPT